MPKLRHPDGGPTVEVDADQVATYEEQGWVLTKKTSAKSGDEPASTAASKKE